VMDLVLVMLDGLVIYVMFAQLILLEQNVIIAPLDILYPNAGLAKLVSVEPIVMSVMEVLIQIATLISVVLRIVLVMVFVITKLVFAHALAILLATIALNVHLDIQLLMLDAGKFSLALHLLVVEMELVTCSKDFVFAMPILPVQIVLNQPLLLKAIPVLLELV